MFWIPLAVIALLCALVCLVVALVLDRQGDGATPFCWSAFFGVVALLIAGYAVWWSMLASSNQRHDKEELIKIDQVEQIYEKRADEYIQEFAHYLAELYPNFEKEIFDKIKPENIDMYMVKFPEVKTQEGVLELVKQIRLLNDDRFNQQIDRSETLRDMRYRKESPWVFQFVMPDIEVPEILPAQ